MELLLKNLQCNYNLVGTIHMAGSRHKANPQHEDLGMPIRNVVRKFCSGLFSIVGELKYLGFHMLDFFQKITDVLSECEIPYMLSGSVAMSLYILPRATRDFAFIVNLESKNLDSFINNFQKDYYCDKDAIEEAVKHKGLFNIIDHASGFKADFVVLKNEPFRQTEFSRRIPMNYFGKQIFVVSPEDLIISKLIWIQQLQSSIQKEDIKNLVGLENLDWPYINLWIDKLKLNTFNLLKQ